ncbi:hypothetical protein QBC32DRAFT_401322 [Pseudoneurospora amorphoporcata]|uniref:Heterokaryon incompatibility domain-containing protein n=1 Tax=Pseudoneurospora amorphoporcata TaxID=241081 RepID=A0AAN6NL33_9PEZI|nr:hypothetical protein QBC32DRAFT_401322 [Pseudoneurospora amorphoporcata]
MSRGYIRLLQLLPSEDEDAAIHCRLFPATLDSKGTRPYEALSYVWGSEDKPCSISINGCDLAVGKNLYVAMLYFRDHFIERTIWIDAICIKQGDNEEKGHQVQSMAKIYAKASRLSIRRLDDNIGILILLQRPWFQRIWVLQEIAAARHILIKCGSTEVDGSVFCLGLDALNLFNESTDLQARILSVTYLIRGAIFRPKYAISQSDNFSLNIRPLGELIEMYYTREATNRRDKVYALLDLSDDKEIVVIEGKGCILGEVSSVKRNATWEDRQDVAITWRNCPSYICVKEAWVSCWTLPTTVKSVQKGDIVCLFQGATRPTILRPYNDHWTVIIIAVSLAGDLQATIGDIKWSELLQSITVFPHNFLLIWDWNINLDRQQDKNNHDYFASIPEHSKTGLEGCLDAATRIRNVRLRALRSMSTLKKTCLGPEDLEKEDAKETMMLLDISKVDVGAKDENGQIALHRVAMIGHEVVVQLLLDIGKVDAGAQDTAGQTALHSAAWNGHQAVVKLLLDTGKVDADVKDKDGRTALYWAISNGYEAVVKLLSLAS